MYGTYPLSSHPEKGIIWGQNLAHLCWLAGLGLIALSLCMDGTTGGLQDRVKKSTKEINREID